MRKNLKKLATLGLVAGLSVMSSITAFAGEWKQDEIGWWYQNDDGTYLTNTWYQIPAGLWFYMGEDGYMLTSTTTPDGYWVNANGVWISAEVMELAGDDLSESHDIPWHGVYDDVYYEAQKAVWFAWEKEMDEIFGREFNPDEFYYFDPRKGGSVVRPEDFEGWNS